MAKQNANEVEYTASDVSSVLNFTAEHPDVVDELISDYPKMKIAKAVQYINENPDEVEKAAEKINDKDAYSEAFGTVKTKMEEWIEKENTPDGSDNAYRYALNDRYVQAREIITDSTYNVTEVARADIECQQLARPIEYMNVRAAEEKFYSDTAADFESDTYTDYVSRSYAYYLKYEADNEPSATRVEEMDNLLNNLSEATRDSLIADVTANPNKYDVTIESAKEVSLELSDTVYKNSTLGETEFTNEVFDQVINDRYDQHVIRQQLRPVLLI